MGYTHYPMTSYYLGTGQAEAKPSGPLDLAAYELYPVYENDFSQAATHRTGGGLHHEVG